MEIFEIKDYDFNSDILKRLSNNLWVKDLWALVYILSDEFKAEAYVGETTDALSRLSNHLANPKKNKLKKIHLITSHRFNKSATLDIESNLIKYFHGDGRYKMLNGNLGIANHSYYEKDLVYWDIFKTIWCELQQEKIVSKDLKDIDNSDIFKYSPYKSLDKDQLLAIKHIVSSLANPKGKSIVVEGGAGTGKSILAVYLFKLLYTDIDDIKLMNMDVEKEFLDQITNLKSIYPTPKVGLVIPMSSFRATIKNVFKNIKGLNAKMVISPAEVSKGKFDILIVDEAHRLRRRTNLGSYYRVFDSVSKRLRLNKKVNDELDWMLKQSKHQVIFYDEKQTIKPSDVERLHFNELITNRNTLNLSLKSQFRVKGGLDYVSYVDKLMGCKFRKNENLFKSNDYDLIMFDDLKRMITAIKERDKIDGLSRLVAGYSWKWVSKKKKVHDINIGGVKLKWNSVTSDWVNNKNAINEVGCIHTTQGYDLNYTGVIFGKEIGYDSDKNEIVIYRDNYFDKNGKNSIEDPEELKNFIINIYKTIMLRGIKGTFIYVCDEPLREYFRKHIKVQK